MTIYRLIQVRIDSTIKNEAASVLASMGLTLSDAVRLLLTRVAQDKTFPLESSMPQSTAVKTARTNRIKKAAQPETLLFDPGVNS